MNDIGLAICWSLLKLGWGYMGSMDWYLCFCEQLEITIIVLIVVHDLAGQCGEKGGGREQGVAWSCGACWGQWGCPPTEGASCVGMSLGATGVTWRIGTSHGCPALRAS